MSFANRWKLIVFLLAIAVVPVAIAYTRAAAQQLWSDVPDPHVHKVSGSLPDFVSLADKLSPAVVNISSTEESHASAHGSAPPGEGGEGGDPLEQFGQPFSLEPRDTRSMGSGFVINPDGYILTNDHVVEDSKKIVVTTRDGRQYTAKLIGRDEKSDIALIKIEPQHPLAAAPLGNSDELKVGEWVMAIGNPFGFDHSVTVGIVSAIGRFIPGNYDDFIQTDASINPGNSGGPLIDLNGAVVGVNAAIYTRTGSSMGIGFAIPINIVKAEIEQLQASGKVTRGWLGVMIQHVTPDLAESLGLPDARGALVAEVIKDGPAAKAGIKHGDVIVEFNHQPVNESEELPLLVGKTKLGSTVPLEVYRDKSQKEIPVIITESREREAVASRQSGGTEKGAPAQFGLFVKDLNPKIAQDLGIKEQKGVLVSSVEPGSPADEAGLHARDLILEVDRQPVNDVASYAQAVRSKSDKKVVLLLIKRGDNANFVTLKPQG